MVISKNSTISSSTNLKPYVFGRAKNIFLSEVKTCPNVWLICFLPMSPVYFLLKNPAIASFSESSNMGMEYVLYGRLGWGGGGGGFPPGDLLPPSLSLSHTKNSYIFLNHGSDKSIQPDFSIRILRRISNTLPNIPNSIISSFVGSTFPVKFSITLLTPSSKASTILVFLPIESTS